MTTFSAIGAVNTDQSAVISLCNSERVCPEVLALQSERKFMPFIVLRIRRDGLR
jgi:hypothetical protein